MACWYVSPMVNHVNFIIRNNLDRHIDFNHSNNAVVSPKDLSIHY